VCPVFGLVGGHQYGYAYVGAIGLVLTYFYHGREKARHLVENCIHCEACRTVCAAGIDLPLLIKTVHARIQDEEGHSLKRLLLADVMVRPKLFHGMLRIAGKAQRPLTGGTPYLRHLSPLLTKEHRFRTLPAMAPRPFHDMWKVLKPHVKNPKYRVALFAGCLHDFVYTNPLQAAVSLLADFQVGVEFPLAQSCCGLPLEILGETKAARNVALQNAMVLNPERYDAVLAPCASCAAHLKKGYPRLLNGVISWRADKIMPLSAFLFDVLQMGRDEPKSGDVMVTYHAPCHLSRALGIKDPPRRLIQRAGYNFVPAEEEETCCGFGGTYSIGFPEISSQILSKKVEDIIKTGAHIVVTECPGCVLQLQGGLRKQGNAVQVLHLAELLTRPKT
jgi:Fe-S oxidoreductase